MEKRPNTKVEICFCKPTGWSDTFVVATDDRGAAVKKVLDLYEGYPWLPAINFISASHTGERATSQEVWDSMQEAIEQVKNR